MLAYSASLRQPPSRPQVWRGRSGPRKGASPSPSWSSSRPLHRSSRSPRISFERSSRGKPCAWR